MAIKRDVKLADRTDEAQPVPSAGGSYIRQPDGSLTLSEPPTQDPEAASDVVTDQPVQE